MANTQLQNAFEAFANFGGSRTNLSSATTMDNAHFAKLCRESKILDKNVTTVDVDIFFKKVLTKGERKINFAEFTTAIEHLAKKKYPNDPNAFQKLASQISSASPVASGTKPEAGGIYSKLTDASLYTGSHKERFDADGRGKGLDGRETVSKTSDLSQIVSRNSGSASKKRGVTDSMNKLNSSNQNLSKKVAGSSGKINAAYGLNKSTGGLNKSTGGLNKSSGSLGSLNKSTGSLNQSGNVYDRLTDTKQYTGTHKHRFDADGKGRGIAGRDSASNNNVTSISQILRK